MRLRGRVTVAASAAALLCSAVASVPAEARAQERPVVLRAARMLDVHAGELVADPIVVVDGGRISAIGTAARPPSIPAGAEALDLGDLTLLPGLIDAHTHLTTDLEGDWQHRAVLETAADRALRGAANARRTLRAGFTTVRDLGASGFADVALARAIERGWVEGPEVLPSGHALGILGGHCDETGYRPGVAEEGWREGVADGPDEVVKAVRYQIKHGARVIKVCATAGVLSHEASVGAQQYTAEELEAIVAEAARHGLAVAAHAHGEEGVLAAVRAGVASIEHGSVLSDEAIELMRERGTYLVPTTYLADAIDLDALPPAIRGKAESVLPHAKESLKRAIAAGVAIAFGTDAGVYPHGLNAREFAALVDRGMTPIEAIRAATLRAADLLGLEDRGRIAAGLKADLIAVPGDPLQDVRVLEDVRFVMVAGRVVVGPEANGAAGGAGRPRK